MDPGLDHFGPLIGPNGPLIGPNGPGIGPNGPGIGHFWTLDWTKWTRDWTKWTLDWTFLDPGLDIFGPWIGPNGPGIGLDPGLDYEPWVGHGTPVLEKCRPLCNFLLSYVLLHSCAMWFQSNITESSRLVFFRVPNDEMRRLVNTGPSCT